MKDLDSNCIESYVVNLNSHSKRNDGNITILKWCKNNDITVLLNFRIRNDSAIETNIPDFMRENYVDNRYAKLSKQAKLSLKNILEIK